MSDQTIGQRLLEAVTKCDDEILVLKTENQRLRAYADMHRDDAYAQWQHLKRVQAREAELEAVLAAIQATLVSYSMPESQMLPGWCIQRVQFHLTMAAATKGAE